MSIESLRFYPLKKKTRYSLKPLAVTTLISILLKQEQ